jgi:hypothetical protein
MFGEQVDVAEAFERSRLTRDHRRAPETDALGISC